MNNPDEHKVTKRPKKRKSIVRRRNTHTKLDRKQRREPSAEVKHSDGDQVLGSTRDALPRGGDGASDVQVQASASTATIPLSSSATLHADADDADGGVRSSHQPSPAAQAASIAATSTPTSAHSSVCELHIGVVRRSELEIARLEQEIQRLDEIGRQQDADIKRLRRQLRQQREDDLLGAQVNKP